MAKTKSKPNRGFMDGYKTYSPEVEGYGSPEQWRESFFDRMGVEQAQELLGERDPLRILGFVAGRPSWDEIKAAFRRLMLEWHPDRNAHRLEEALRKSKEIIAAFEVLEARYEDRF